MTLKAELYTSVDELRTDHGVRRRRATTGNTDAAGMILEAMTTGDTPSSETTKDILCQELCHHAINLQIVIVHSVLMNLSITEAVAAHAAGPEPGQYRRCPY